MGYAKRVYNNNLQEQILDYNLYKKRKKKIT